MLLLVKLSKEAMHPSLCQEFSDHRELLGVEPVLFDVLLCLLTLILIAQSEDKLFLQSVMLILNQKFDSVKSIIVNQFKH